MESGFPIQKNTFCLLNLRLANLGPSSEQEGLETHVKKRRSTQRDRLVVQVWRPWLYLQAVHHGDGGDGLGHGAHALIEGVLGLVCADDGPGRPVVDHLFVGLFGTWRSLQTEVKYKLDKCGQCSSYKAYWNIAEVL